MSLCLNPPAHCNLGSRSTKRQAWPGQTSSCSQDTCGHVTSRDINEAAHGTFSQNPHAYPVLESTACSGNTDPSNLCESVHHSNLMKWEYRTLKHHAGDYRTFRHQGMTIQNDKPQATEIQTLQNLMLLEQRIFKSLVMITQYIQSLCHENTGHFNSKLREHDV
jgi:hypothetical protein